MYAVFGDGSRQYRVKPGDLVKVDFRKADAGQRVEFPRVLLMKGDAAAEVGLPVIAGAPIVGEGVEQASIKSVIQQFRRRKRYRRLKGHRQPYTVVRVQHLLAKGQEPPPAQETPAPAPQSGATA